jgi:hypothetical protein
MVVQQNLLEAEMAQAQFVQPDANTPFTRRIGEYIGKRHTYLEKRVYPEAAVPQEFSDTVAPRIRNLIENSNWSTSFTKAQRNMYSNGVSSFFPESFPIDKYVEGFLEGTDLNNYNANYCLCW